jgi:EmrB/QacA subfamily drug resistance transporter
MQVDPFKNTIRGLLMNETGQKSKIYIIVAALLALFLSALDALIMGAAMPTIVADLGGLPLYSWVFSSYMLARAVFLPIFGKLCDLYKNKTLFNLSIGLFLAGSVCAGLSGDMIQLILSRVIQGMGAGGSFALVYIVLADISSPEKRGKMMSLASFVWGLASVLGPTLGGILVNFCHWRWIFFINLPLGGICLIWISMYLSETREKRKKPAIDFPGIFTLSTTILGVLFIFLLGGRQLDWVSLPMGGLCLATLLSGWGFYHAEKIAKEPILSLDFFRIRNFRTGNGAAFFSSFAIFSLATFFPLFIQGALGKTPAQLGLAMVSLSLGWSLGALGCGQIIHRAGSRICSLAGALFLLAGSGLSLTFTPASTLGACALAMGLAGIGMGLVSIATLLVVQSSLGQGDLGVATASHQFTRTLGGAMGVGISGSLVTAKLIRGIDTIAASRLGESLPPAISQQLKDNVDSLFQPDFQALLSPAIKAPLYGAIADGVMMVFWATALASAVGLVLSLFLPKKQPMG